MLFAEPGEYLGFSLVISKGSETKKEITPLRMETLSNKKKKKFEQKMRMVQEKYKAKKNSKTELINPVKKPRYDDIYIKGIQWLEEQAGPKLTPSKNIARFSDDVWKSMARKGEDAD